MDMTTIWVKREQREWMRSEARRLSALMASDMTTADVLAALIRAYTQVHPEVASQHVVLDGMPRLDGEAVR